MFLVELGNPHRISSWTLYLNLECRLSNSVNYDWVQVLSYSKYSLLVLPVVGIEPATSRWFHSEALSNQTLYPLHHVSLLDNSEWIFGTYKPNMSVNSCDTPLHYHIRCFCTIAHIAGWMMPILAWVQYQQSGGTTAPLPNCGFVHPAQKKKKR